MLWPNGGCGGVYDNQLQLSVSLQAVSITSCTCTVCWDVIHLLETCNCAYLSYTSHSLILTLYKMLPFCCSIAESHLGLCDRVLVFQACGDSFV